MPNATTTTFTQELWESIAPIYQSILDHPFLKGLTDGSLPKESFQYYVQQDWRYLQYYARCLALASSKAPDTASCRMFAEHARSALIVEEALHEGFFRDWGIPPGQAELVTIAPTNLAYTSYLGSVATTAPFEEVVGAILPCYWIYWEVGKTLQEKGSPDPLFQRWIDTYASEAFANSVREVLAVMDSSVADLPPSRRAAVAARFLQTSRYEWMFWDAAWRLEQWPV